MKFSPSRFFLSLVSLLTFSLCSLQVDAAQLTVKPDRTQMALEETLNLDVQINEQVGFSSPNFSVLQQDFEIVGRSQSNRYHSINGQVESLTQWHLTLAPKHTGTLTIPTLELNGSRSEPQTIEVSDSVASPAVSTEDKPVYLEAELNKGKLFVQEQLLLTVRLVTSVNLARINSEELNLDNVVVKQVSENQYTKRINGRQYGVVEVTYALFPQQSGDLKIPAITWQVTLENNRRDPLFNSDPFLLRGGERLRVKSQEHSVSVLPQPGNYPANTTWLPATDVTLDQTWSRSPGSFTVGEPITRTLTLKAQGLTAAQLPPLTTEEPAGIKFYPDQPQSDESESASGMVATRRESYAIVPTRPGKYLLPAVVVHWWDIDTNRLREASLPAQEIIVAAGSGNQAHPISGSTVSQPVNPDNTQSSIPVSLTDDTIWPWVSAVLTFTNLVTLLVLVLVWRRKDHQSISTTAGLAVSQNGQNEKRSLGQLQQACRTGSVDEIRASLITWGASHWPDEAITNLQQIAAQAQSTELIETIYELDAALYSDRGDNTFDGDRLFNAIQKERNTASSPSETSVMLPALNP